MPSKWRKSSRPECQKRHCHARCCSRKLQDGQKTYFAYWKDHRCNDRSCPDLKTGNSPFCTAHQRCYVPACDAPMHQGSWFCYIHTFHTCEVDGCGQRRTRGRRCSDHKPCLRANCQNFAERHGSHCEKHKPCSRPNCLDWEESGFCSGHTCWLKHCKQDCTDGGMFCADHTCIVSDCTQTRRGSRSALSEFCIHHQCQHGDCVKGSIIMQGYCKHHECTARECHDKRASADSSRCEQHECRHKGCLEASQDKGGYCQTNNHACAEPGCLEAAVADSRKLSIGSGSRAPLCVAHLVQRASASCGKCSSSESFHKHGSSSSSEESDSDDSYRYAPRSSAASSSSADSYVHGLGRRRRYSRGYHQSTSPPEGDYYGRSYGSHSNLHPHENYHSRRGMR